VAGGPQLALNLAVLAVTTLPRGGRIEVQVFDRGATVALRLTASGTGAKLADAVLAVAPGHERPPDHAHIPAWYGPRLASQLDGPIKLTLGTGEVRIEVMLERLAD